MEGLKAIPYISLILAIAGIVVGAGVIVSSQFSDTITNPCWNSSYTLNTSTPCAHCGASAHCDNTSECLASGPAQSNLSREYFSVSQSMESQVDVSEQLPTVAIIAVMVIIISIIAGVFIYLRYFS